MRRLGFDDLDDFAALELAAVRASAMSTDLLMAVWAFCQLRDVQCIMGTTVRSPALRVAAFGIRHVF
jgi:hypothetical protein